MKTVENLRNLSKLLSLMPNFVDEEDEVICPR